MCPPIDMARNNNNIDNIEPRAQPSTEPQRRPLYLLIFGGAIFHAHWSFYIPRLDSVGEMKGKRAQVEGNPHSGFRLELVRGCNLSVDEPRPVQMIEIGRLDAAHVQDGPEISEWTVDENAVDIFEEACLGVAPPTPSLREQTQVGSQSRCSFQVAYSSSWTLIPAKPGQKPRRIEIRDCQWWATQVVATLVDELKLWPPDGGNYKGQSPTSIMQKVPKHA